MAFLGPLVSTFTGSGGGADCGDSMINDMKGCQSIKNRQKNFTDNTMDITAENMNNVTESSNIKQYSKNEVEMDVKITNAYEGCDVNVSMENVSKLVAIVQSRSTISSDVSQKVTDKMLQELDTLNDQKNSGIGVLSQNSKIENDIENHVNNSRKITTEIGNNIAKGLNIEQNQENKLRFNYNVVNCYAPITVKTANNADLAAQAIWDTVLDAKVDQDLEAITSQASTLKNSQVSKGLDPFEFITKFFELIANNLVIAIVVGILVVAFIIYLNIAALKAAKSFGKNIWVYIYPISIVVLGVGGSAMYLIPIILNLLGADIDYSLRILLQLIAPILIAAALFILITKYQYTKSINTKIYSQSRILEEFNEYKENWTDDRSPILKFFGLGKPKLNAFRQNFLLNASKQSDFFVKTYKYDDTTKQVFLAATFGLLLNLYVLVLFVIPDKNGVPLAPLKAQDDSETYSFRFKFDVNVSPNETVFINPVDENDQQVTEASMKLPEAVGDKYAFVREIRIVNSWIEGLPFTKSNVNEKVEYKGKAHTPFKYTRLMKKISSKESDLTYNGYSSVMFTKSGTTNMEPIKYCSGSKEYGLDFFVGLSNKNDVAMRNINYRRYPHNSTPSNETHKRQYADNNLSKSIMLVDGLIRNITQEDAFGLESELKDEDGEYKEDTSQFTIGKKLGYAYGFPDNSCKVFCSDTNVIPFSLVNIPGTTHAGADTVILNNYQYFPYIQVKAGPNCSGRLQGEFCLQMNLFKPVYTSTMRMKEDRRESQRKEDSQKVEKIDQAFLGLLEQLRKLY